MSTPSSASPVVWIDSASSGGYARAENAQRDFQAAADHLRETDGYVNPADPVHRKQLRADLAPFSAWLGVKG